MTKLVVYPKLLLFFPFLARLPSPQTVGETHKKHGSRYIFRTEALARQISAMTEFLCLTQPLLSIAEDAAKSRSLRS